MPGKQDLEIFREELTRLGNERAVAAERGETFEELPFPGDAAKTPPDIDVDSLISSLGSAPVAPASIEEPAASDEPAATESPDALEEPSAPEEASAFGGMFEPEDNGTPPETPFQGEEPDLASLDSLLSSLDLGEVPVPDVPAPDFSDDFSIPEDLLSGFAEEVETARESPEDASSVESLDELGNMEDFSALEMDFTPDFEGIQRAPEPERFSVLPEEPSAPEFPDAEAFGLETLEPEPLDEEPREAAFPEVDIPEGDLPGDMLSLGDDFSVPSVSDIPSIDEALASMNFALENAGEESPPEADMPGLPGDLFGAGAAPDFPGIDDIGSPKAPSAPSNPDDLSDLSLPEEFALPGESGPGEASPEIDGFEGFSLDEDFLKSTIDNVGDEEFHIPGFADFASGSSDQLLSDISAASRSGGGKKEVPLHISEEELDRLFENISRFPLNLRIAAEEFIAGDTGTDVQKMELIQTILREAPLRKIAHILSDALGKTIEVPKDFEKKSFAEYEEEKSSLRYVFLNRVLPILTMGAIAATLLACVGYLSWQFIYRPIAAEILYNRGYTAIENELYPQSQDLFNQAVAKWDKKRWYFTYARAYRDRRQYLLAERMYSALLARFNNDKAAGLEYARMLLEDLRNFEKAETVLRRRVLDNYVNDSEGLMLLGDVFLEWAEEDPSKFEEARKSYAALIELYGKKDPYLARMMRYFIRTDNLAEVLPLKDHFLAKSAKIGAQDLVELGGYLVDKRYEPGPGDSEALRNQIEDVRKVLERAVESDAEIPEAHYNMGRFLIYNYDTDLAYRALDEARRLFDAARVMTPRRVIRRVDNYRLLGELRARKGEYLDALDLYASGIDIFETQRANGAVGKDRRVGMLYADSADIDYFLVNGQGDALMKYRSAVAELYDTPSIRYRIGWLNYASGDFGAAYDSFSLAHIEKPGDRNALYSLGNTLMRRDDIFLAQGYYELLMGSLDAERIRKGVSFPSPRTDFRDFVEEYVKASNNLGVSLYRIAERSGDSRKYARAGALFAESIRASDSLTRDPVSVIRSDAQALAALNLKNMTHPKTGFVPEIYVDIPKLMQGEEPLRQLVDQ